MKDIITTKTVVFAALFLALFFPGPADFFKDFLIVVLIVMMTISIKKINVDPILSGDKKFIALLVILNTFVLGALYVLGAYLLIENALYQNAIILYALMPPAVGIVSLGYLYGVDMKLDLYSEFIAYLASLAVIPLGAYIFLREVVNPLEIVQVIGLILILPFILSRFVNKYYALSKKASKVIITICFGIVIYTVVGFNLESIVENVLDIVNIIVLFTVLRFGLILLIYWVAKKYVDHGKVVLLTLFGTLKNGAAATGIALLVLGPESTAPLAVEILFFSFTLILLDYLFKPK